MTHARSPLLPRLRDRKWSCESTERDGDSVTDWLRNTSPNFLRAFDERVAAHDRNVDENRKRMERITFTFRQ